MGVYPWSINVWKVRLPGTEVFSEMNKFTLLEHKTLASVITLSLQLQRLGPFHGSTVSLGKPRVQRTLYAAGVNVLGYTKAYAPHCPSVGKRWLGFHPTLDRLGRYIRT